MTNDLTEVLGARLLPEEYTLLFSSGGEGRGDREGGRDRDKGKRTVFVLFCFVFKKTPKNKQTKGKKKKRAYLGISKPPRPDRRPTFLVHWYFLCR